jgi:DNA (cytosine-5)-methyltransferase 1
MLRILDLFSGVGAFSLGLERAGGFRTVAFCECDPFRRAVLAKHWPGVPCYPDVRELTGERLRADGIAVDLVCGGFPCQDVSLAGSGLGLSGERSGLWREMRRIIGELRPRFALVENTAALNGRGLLEILGDFTEIGIRHVEWHNIPAAAVGAPHLRDRTWIVAWLADVADADGEGLRCEREPQHRDVEGASGRELDGCGPHGRRAWARGRDEPADLGLAGGARLQIGPRTFAEWAHSATAGTDRRQSQSRLGRALDGPAEGLDPIGWGPGWEDGVSRTVETQADKVNRRARIAAIGDSLVPDIPEIIGRAIMRMA